MAARRCQSPHCVAAVRSAFSSYWRVHIHQAIRDYDECASCNEKVLRGPLPSALEVQSLSRALTREELRQRALECESKLTNAQTLDDNDPILRGQITRWKVRRRRCLEEIRVAEKRLSRKRVFVEETKIRLKFQEVDVNDLEKMLADQKEKASMKKRKEEKRALKKQEKEKRMLEKQEKAKRRRWRLLLLPLKKFKMNVAFKVEPGLQELGLQEKLRLHQEQLNL